MHGLLHALLEASGLQGVSLAALLAADVLALVTTPSVLRSRRGRPSKALAWLLAIWVFPFVGVLAWWSIGRLRVRRPRQLRERPCAPPLVSAAPPVLTDRVPSAWWQSGEMLPPCGGNRVELLADRLAFEAMAEAIEGAQRSIDALFYIWKDDETGRRLLARLAARARAGVEVRLLVDAVGSPASDATSAPSWSRPVATSRASSRSAWPASTAPTSGTTGRCWWWTGAMPSRAA